MYTSPNCWKALTSMTWISPILHAADFNIYTPHPRALAHTHTRVKKISKCKLYCHDSQDSFLGKFSNRPQKLSAYIMSLEADSGTKNLSGMKSSGFSQDSGALPIAHALTNTQVWSVSHIHWFCTFQMFLEGAPMVLQVTISCFPSPKPSYMWAFEYHFHPQNISPQLKLLFLSVLSSSSSIFHQSCHRPNNSGCSCVCSCH